MITEDLRVRRHFVEKWLRYLQSHSQVPGYMNMVLSTANIACLPIDGVPDDLPTIVDTELDFNIYQTMKVMQTCPIMI